MLCSQLNAVVEFTLRNPATSGCVSPSMSRFFRRWSPRLFGSKSKGCFMICDSLTRTHGKKATPLCPCGYLGHHSGKCRCTPDQVARYRSRISGPLLDRIDLQIEVPALPQEDLTRHAQGDTSAPVRERVTAARERALARQDKPNNMLATREIDKHCAADEKRRDVVKAGDQQHGPVGSRLPSHSESRAHHCRSCCNR